MKRIHLLRTTVTADSVAGIVAEAGAQGLRVGWLDLTADPVGGTTTRAVHGGQMSQMGQLERAAELGVLRAVAVAGGRAVAVKRVTGPATLRDLLREYFLGCAAVLVRVPPGGSPPAVDGAGTLPLLDPIGVQGNEWRVVPPDSGALRLTTAELVGRLRRPRPWTSGS